jgi:hypothetical protein
MGLPVDASLDSLVRDGANSSCQEGTKVSEAERLSSEWRQRRMAWRDDPPHHRGMEPSREVEQVVQIALLAASRGDDVELVLRRVLSVSGLRRGPVTAAVELLHESGCDRAREVLVAVLDSGVLAPCRELPSHRVMNVERRFWRPTTAHPGRSRR